MANVPKTTVPRGPRLRRPGHQYQTGLGCLEAYRLGPVFGSTTDHPIANHQYHRGPWLSHTPDLAQPPSTVLLPALLGRPQPFRARSYLDAIQVLTRQTQPEKPHIVMFSVVVGAGIRWRGQDQVEAARRKLAEIARIS